MKQADRIVRDIGILYTLQGEAGPRRGTAMRELGEIPGAAVAMKDGAFAAVGPEKDVLEAWRAGEVVSAGGRVATPGLVDAHTHPIFAGDRSLEFERRLQGVSYSEIAAEGGGIRATVRATRAASEAELLRLATARADRMLALGTTTAEAKSGYGLDLETERRSLEAIAALNRSHPVEFVPTCLAAHEVPDEFRADRAGYIERLETVVLPALRPLARFCDIFCEVGVFSVEESRRVLLRARWLGYELKLHVDELADSGGALLAAELGARSADHLVHVSDEGIRALKKAGVIPVLLPITTFYLRKPAYAPGRRMVDEGLPVAIATDLNPGTAHSESLPLAMSVACIGLGLLPSEALVAATVNAAHAIGAEERAGIVAPGRPADLVVWDAASHREIASHLGVPLAHQVWKRGRLVAEDGRRKTPAA